MSVQCVHLGDGERRQAPMDGGPAAEILFGPEPGRSMGAIEVTIPADGQMGFHSHGDSETLVIPREGAIRMYPQADESEPIVLEPGALVSIPVGETVRLDNSGSPEGKFLAVLSPAGFIRELEVWPLASAAAAS